MPGSALYSRTMNYFWSETLPGGARVYITSPLSTGEGGKAYAVILRRGRESKPVVICHFRTPAVEEVQWRSEYRHPDLTGLEAALGRASRACAVDAVMAA